MASGSGSVAQADTWRRWRTWLSVAVAAALVAVLLARLDLAAARALLSGADWRLVAAAAGAFALSIGLRGVRWRRLAGTVDATVPEATAVILRSWALNCLVPAKLGDLHRAVDHRSRYGSPTSTTLGALFVERVLDLQVVALLVLGSAPLAFGPVVPPAARPVLVASATITAGLGTAVGALSLWGGRVLERLPPRLRAAAGRFRDAAASALAPGRLPALVGVTLVIWGLEALRLWAVAAGFGLVLPTSLALFVALAAAILTVLPLTPAGLGVVELAVAALLGLAGAEADRAIVIALVDRGIAYWAVLAAGGLLFLPLGRAGRRGGASPGASEQ